MDVFVQNTLILVVKLWFYLDVYILGVGKEKEAVEKTVARH